MQDLVPGSQFAGYNIEQVIGRGGMGVVYRARDTSLNRPVAIKLLNDSYASDPGLRQRFEREARLMAALDHPNVIPIYTAGEEHGRLYLVMRYVDGTDLQQQLRLRGRLPAEEAARIVSQVGQALDAAHARGLVHRDIKPANVLLSGDHVYLTDFGITRVVDEHTRFTESGNWVGTVDYMSPEHLRGDVTDARSDVYSLGCLLYTCLAGTPPFHRESTAATITAQLHDRVPKVSQAAGVPKRFDDVLTRALAKRPKDRYPSAGRLGTAALAAAQGRAAAAAREQGRFRAKPDPGEQPTRIVPPTHVVPSVPLAAEPDENPSLGDKVRHHRPLIAGRSTRVDRRAVTARPATAHAGAGRGWRNRRVGRDPASGGEATSGRRRSGARTWSRGRVISVIGMLAVVVAAVVVAVIVSGGGAAPAGPLKRTEVTAVVQRFAGDYSRRDGHALERVLALQVMRISDTDSEHGRAAVLKQYEQQFRAKPIPVGYELSDLQVTPGWAGRATADYKLTLAGGGTISGRVTFGVERIRGNVQIGLIVTS